MTTMTILTPEQALLSIGQQLRDTRGLTHSELSALMLAMLAVCGKILGDEGQIIVNTVLGQLESEAATKQ